MKETKNNAFGSRFKMIYSIIQMIIFYLAVCIFPNYDVLCLIIVILTYLIPLYIDSYIIKFMNRDRKLKEYFLEDFLFYFLPSIASSLLIELLLHFIGITNKELLGFFTVVLFIAFSMLTLFQWLRFFIQYKISNKSKTEK